MSKLFPSTLFLLAILLGYGGLASAAQSEDSAVAQIESYLNAAVENDTFSGSVLIAHDGEILLSEGYGLANQEWDVPNSPDTKFRIGSITKQFTAMSILILQERGLLTVQDHACRYFDECPEAWQDITIEHLLTHTSGIRDYYELPDFEPRLPILPQNLIELFINLPLNFQPGTRWSYSDSGYIVLGRIIEAASGESYRRFLRENIFDPLGMANTDYNPDTSVVIEHRAQGYISLTRNAADFDISNAYAAGGMYSTVEDLYTWEQALFAGRVVSQESWDAMLAAAVPVPDSPEGLKYGYGLILGSLDDHPYVRHSGGINGFASSMGHFTDDNLTIIVLGNIENLNGWSLVETIARIIFDEG